MSTKLTSQNYPRVTWTPRNSSHPPPDNAVPRSEAYATVLSETQDRKKAQVKREQTGQTVVFHFILFFKWSTSTTITAARPFSHNKQS